MHNSTKKPIVALVMDRYSTVIHQTIADYATRNGWALDATMAVASERYPVPHADAILAVYVISNQTRNWLASHSDVPVVHIRLSEEDIKNGWSGVTEEGETIGRLVAEHYINLGFQNFAFYQRWRGPRSDLRRSGFCETLKRAGFTCNCLVSGEKLGESDPIAWLSTKLKNLKRPLALFVQDDLRGTECVNACRHAELRIPDDVAIIGVGNDDLMTHSSGVPLSSVDIRIETMALTACNMLAERLVRPKGKQKIERIEPAGIISRLSSDTRAVASPVVTRALTYIRNHLARGVEAGDVATRMGCSRRWLDHEFILHLGHSCTAEISRQRISRAAQMLIDTDDTIEIISNAVGIDNMPRFFRQFKRQIGQTPAQYRLSKLS